MDPEDEANDDIVHDEEDEREDYIRQDHDVHDRLNRIEYFEVA